MVDRVAGGKALPAEVLEQIVAKTDGVPLFVEELTKTVLESGLLREENGAYVLASALTPLAIPSTLQDSLMARLDRLAPVKEIAQIGAAIGREFSYRLLEAVSPIQGPALQDALGQLMAAELIHARGAPPEATYVFKHALVQDTAYASLLRSRRQRIHADIARALEERFPDQIEAAPAIIAHHYTEAGLDEPAARYWLAAAELALSRSANAEADRYVDAGLGADPAPAGWAGPPISRTGASDRPRQRAAAAEGLQRAGNGRGLDGGEAASRRRRRRPICSASPCSMAFARPDTLRRRLEPALALAREMVEVADRQDDTTYRLVGLSPARHDPASAWGKTARRWKICNRPNDTAILAGKSCSAIGSERSRPQRPLLQDMGADFPRPPRSGGARQRAGADRARGATNMPRRSRAVQLLRHGVARVSVGRFRSLRTP